MTLRSRINQRSQHPVARAERVATRRRADLESGARLLSPVVSPVSPVSTVSPTVESSPTSERPQLASTAASWDVPCSSLRAPAARRSTTRRRPALTAVPVDWSAVRHASSC